MTVESPGEYPPKDGVRYAEKTVESRGAKTPLLVEAEIALPIPSENGNSTNITDRQKILVLQGFWRS